MSEEVGGGEIGKLVLGSIVWLLALTFLAAGTAIGGGLMLRLFRWAAGF